ncbi:MAG: LysR family transcriptional regulator [Devosia sp.]|uniref:LysR family transcriptional regulator n=1 Tax=Devosia sp. TaxID=1871048 RepID=UPI00339B2E23
MTHVDSAELRAFITIAEHRSFRGAARVLGVTPSALSHAMRALEERLAVRLLTRTTRSVSLTDAGEKLIARVRPAIADLDEAVLEITSVGERLSGTVRISAPDDAARMLIRSVVPKFRTTYPGIEIEIIAENRMVDIVADGFDAGVRLLDGVQKDMVAVRFGPKMRTCAVASPAYLAGKGIPGSPNDLLAHDCIRLRFESGTLYRWELERSGRSHNVDVKGPVTVSKMELGIDAAIAGLGIAWVAEHLIQDHVSAGRLVRFMTDWGTVIDGYSLYYPANRHLPQGLRHFVASVREWRPSD